MSTLSNLTAELAGREFEAEPPSGYAFVRYARAPDALLAWIDETFGGTWSSEAYAGKTIAAMRGSEFAGFVTYAPRGLKFSWLRAWRDRPGTGIFGPFGVAPAHRGGALGRALLHAGLRGLQEDGNTVALIPAVGDEKLRAYYAANAGAHVVEEFDRAKWLGRRIPTTVLASGGGTNFEAVAEAVAAARLPLELNAVVTNKAGAFVIQRAEKRDIPYRITLEWDRTVESRNTYDARLLDAVRRTEPELVLLLGWMHLLSGECLAAFPDTINIHPAYLPLDQTRDEVGLSDGSSMPAFRGAHAIRDALAAGVVWTGASSHLVTLQTDRGDVLVRKPVNIESAKTEEAVLEALRPTEHGVLLGGIMRWIFER